MQISRRLAAVSDMVTSGRHVADIGTDHAYIPIFLVESGKIERAIAMDVNKGPLRKAEENIRAHGLSDRIETRLSDGLERLAPGEADGIIIAGMGGPLTVRILTDGADRLPGCRELILQPQSDIRLVRAFLEERGWQIVREEMIREEGKYYPMMRAARAEAGDGIRRMTEAELRYGPLLLAARHPVLREFLEHERLVNLRIAEALEGQKTESAAKRMEEVRRELEIIGQAQARI